MRVGDLTAVLYGIAMKIPAFLEEPLRIPVRPIQSWIAGPSAGRRRAALVRRAVGGMLLGGLLAAGCDRQSESTSRSTGEPRIVSLSPALTTMLVDVGASETLVGRTPWCRGVDDRPVVGTLEGVDAEVLVAIAPTIVVHQPPATGTDPVLAGLQARLGFTLIGGRLDGIEDIDASLEAFRIHGLGDPEAIDRWRRRLEETFGAVARRRTEADGPTRPRIAIVHSVDPFGVAGTGTYLDEVLIAAGGVNAIQPPGWRTIGVETLLAADPDAVLVIGGVSLPDMVARLEAVPWSDPVPILQLDDADAMEPSTRICGVADRVAALIASTPNPGTPR